MNYVVEVLIVTEAHNAHMDFESMGATVKNSEDGKHMYITCKTEEDRNKICDNVRKSMNALYKDKRGYTLRRTEEAYIISYAGGCTINFYVEKM